MKKFITIQILIIFTFLSTNAQTIIDNINIDGTLRTFRIFIPEQAQGQTDLPLVFNFHGFGSTAGQQEVYSIMDSTAAENNFIVVYPQGIDNAWNVGFLGTSETDIEFTEKIIDKLYFDYQIDLSKVYSCGMSNGGYFSYVLACEIPERFAAIASVTGSMLNDVMNDCTSTVQMPVLQIHGTDDEIVAIDGNGNYGTSIDDVLNFWASKNNCDSITVTEMIADIDMTDASTVEKITYQNCDAEVVFFKVINGTHTWPDALLNLTGVTNRDINASDEIWNFFKDYEISNPIIPSSTAIEQINLESNILNNPFNNNLQLSANELFTDVIIYDSSMKIVKSLNHLNSNSLNINTTTLLSGIYFVAVKSAKGTNFIKAIKM